MAPIGEAEPDGADEGRLIDRALRGDERAFRDLYGEHSARLFRLALRMTRGVDADAEDVLQEAWRRALEGLAGFERRSSLATWLSAIVVRCALEKHRADRWVVEGPSSEVPVGSGEGSASSRLDLERAFERLPSGFRAVLVLHDLEGYRHADIAELLGVAEGTSKSQLSRARARMRELLGESYERE